VLIFSFTSKSSFYTQSSVFYVSCCQTWTTYDWIGYSMLLTCGSMPLEP
jgi:hypothetical protein